jgi:hypothetical protein
MLSKKYFAMSGEQHRFKIKCKCAILIQNIRPPEFDRFKFEFHNSFTETFSTASVKLGHSAASPPTSGLPESGHGGAIYEYTLSRNQRAKKTSGRWRGRLPDCSRL